MQNETIDLNKLLSEYPNMSELSKRSWIAYGLNNELTDLLDVFSEDIQLARYCREIPQLIHQLKTKSLHWLFQKNILTNETRDLGGYHMLYHCLHASRLNPTDPRPIEIVSLFLQNGTDIFSLNLVNLDRCYKFSAIEMAASNLDVRMVEFLLDHDATPCETGDNPETRNAIYYANHPIPVATNVEKSKKQIFNLFYQYGYGIDMDVEAYERHRNLI